MLRMEYQEQITDLGLRIFPLRGKKPLKGVHWKIDAACKPVSTPSYGIVCDKIAVIDADTRSKAVEIFQNKPRTPWMVKTRRGVHFYYRGSPDLTIGQFDEWDLRAGGNGYVVGPGSLVKGFRYELVKGCRITLDLPEFDPEWLACKPPSVELVNPRTELCKPLTREKIHHVNAYLSRIESIQGNGGSRGLIRAAAVCRDAGLSEAEAMLKLLWWNGLAVVCPPWLEAELARAVTRVYAKVKQ